MATSSLSLSTATSSSLGTNRMNNTIGGIDVDALVSATIQAKSLPIVLLQNKNSRLQAQMNDYKTIRSSLLNLQYAVTDLTYASAFTGRKASSTDEKVVTASAQNGSTNGSYVITVGSTATVTSNTSSILGNAGRKSYAAGTQAYDSGTAVTTGVLTINGVGIGVAAGENISTIVNRINASSAGVTASVGADNKVTITQNTAGPTMVINGDTSGFLTNAGIAQGNGTAGNVDTSAGKKAYVTGTFNLANLNTPIGTTSAIKAGTFYINDKPIEVKTTDTINTIVNKITASSAGVKATVDAGGQITLTQNTAGKDNKITLGSEGTTNFFTAAGITQGNVTPGVNSDGSSVLNDVFTGANAITGGYFSINGTFFSVDPTKDTIDTIVNKINSSTTAGVTAFYNPNTGSISLTSQTAGAKDITLGTAADDDSNFLQKIGLVQGNQVTGKDASVTVNGLSVTPVNNKVTFNNNTFTLMGTGTATVSVENDTDAIVKKVEAFITAYNSAIDAVYSKLNEGGGKNLDSSSDPSVGDLFGDPTLDTINTMLRSMTSSIVTTQDASMQQLSQVGITNGKPGVYDLDKVKNGRLELDTAKLKSALQSNSAAVASLFGNTTRSVSDEIVAPDPAGVAKTFTLQNTSISGKNTVVVNGETYTEVSGTPKKYNTNPVTFNPATDSKDREYSLDYTTGKITFGDPPANNAVIKVSYNYDIDSGSSGSGLFVQLKAKLEDNTKYGGQIDAFSGSNGAISKEMKYNNDRVSDLKTRLAAEQARLYTKYQSMQKILSSLQAQGSYLTAMFASLTSSSKS